MDHTGRRPRSTISGMCSLMARICRSPRLCLDGAPVAQRIEHLTTDQKVTSSNLVGRTLFETAAPQSRSADGLGRLCRFPRSAACSGYRSCDRRDDDDDDGGRASPRALRRVVPGQRAITRAITLCHYRAESGRQTPKTVGVITLNTPLVRASGSTTESQASKTGSTSAGSPSLLTTKVLAHRAFISTR